VLIADNVIRGAYEGIHVENIWGYSISGNVVEGMIASPADPTNFPGVGIICWGSPNALIEGNLVRNCASHGLQAECVVVPESVPRDTLIRGNLFYSCSDAIRLDQANGRAGATVIVEGNGAFSCGATPYTFANIRKLVRINNYPEVHISAGAGAPTDNAPPIGSLYLRTDGGATTTLYVKTGATTWTPK
jgi:hypothetical protein